MPHLLTDFVIGALVLSLAGCAFDDGKPWGVAQFDVSAKFAPDASRLENGLLKTAMDYRIDIESLAVHIEAVELESSSSGEAPAFDPANPPAGYSLCHGGHCHAADGSLVPYNEIAVAQSGGDFLVSQALGDEEVELGPSPTAMQMGECSGQCWLEPGALTTAHVIVHSVHVTGTVTDLRDRLTAPLAIDFDAEVEAVVSAPIDGRVGRGEPGGVLATVIFTMPDGLFDDVDFAAEPDSDSLTSTFKGAIETKAALEVRLTTFDI